MSGERDCILWVFQLADSPCSIFGGGRETVDELLVEAKECWRKAREERISIYGFDLMNIPGGGWRLTASHPKRLLDSIILDNDVKEDILHDARDFLSSKKWYSERGIPFRRGYLLVSYIYTYLHSKPLISLHNSLGL